MNLARALGWHPQNLGVTGITTIGLAITRVDGAKGYFSFPDTHTDDVYGTTIQNRWATWQL